jgi:hypothetical protein
MSRRDAEAIVDVLGGEAIQQMPPSLPEKWMVRFERADGRLVLLHDKFVDEFFDREALEADQCYATIKLH